MGIRDVIFLFCLFGCLTSNSQYRTSTYLSSPRKAIITHLSNLQPNSYNDSLAALPFLSKKFTLKESKQIAVMFKQTLDGNGINIYDDEIPDSPDYSDPNTKKSKYILIEEQPDIYLIRNEKGNWYFPTSSINEIKQWYDKTFLFGSGRLMQWLPKLGTKKFLHLYLYQYIAIFGIIFICSVLYRLLSYITERIFKKLIIRLGYKNFASEKLLWLAARPTSMLLIILLLIFFIPVLQLPVLYTKYIIIFLEVILPLLVTIICYRLVDIICGYLLKISRKTKNTLDDQLVPLLRKALKTFVVLMGTLFILQNLNVPIVPLLTGLSIGGLAFALAAQDTIKNFFGSIMIFVDKPFQVGDWITSQNVDGNVEEVGFRSSRIRTFRNSLIYIPNGKLADNIIDNHGLRKYRRFYTQIAINYDTPPDIIEVFINGLKKIVLKHPKTEKDNFHIYLNEMATSSLNIMFYIFFSVPDWEKELKARHEILLSIIQLAKTMGVDFAFPTNMIHLNQLPDQNDPEKKYMSVQEAEAKMLGFINSK